MLMPTAVLIILVMAAITVDRTIVFADQRSLVATAQAAADDGAAVGTDVEAVRGGQAVTFDRARVDRAIRRAVAVQSDPAHPIALRWHLEGDEIVVELERSVPRLFTRIVPGTGRNTAVHARARSRLLGHDP